MKRQARGPDSGLGPLAVRVRQVRTQQGMTQKELAVAARIDQASLSRLENGRIRELRAGALRRLADALGVSVDYLLGRTHGPASGELLPSDLGTRELLAAYRGLSDQDRLHLIRLSLVLWLNRQLSRFPALSETTRGVEQFFAETDETCKAFLGVLTAALCHDAIARGGERARETSEESKKPGSQESQGSEEPPGGGPTGIGGA